MAKKRTKADRLQRQTEQLDKKLDRRPDEIEKKPSTLVHTGRGSEQRRRDGQLRLGRRFNGLSLKEHPCSKRQQNNRYNPEG
jgi:hypothetical protein